jgi:hypothetical protein
MLTVHEMAEGTGISYASCWDILTDYLGMKHVSARCAITSDTEIERKLPVCGFLFA